MFDKIVYNKIPDSWEEYLPLGNGRLGCMIKTHPCTEVIQLNEENIWSGGPQNRINPDTLYNLDSIRKLISSGNVLEAQSKAFNCMSGMNFNDRVYQTAGDFKIDFYSEDDNTIQAGWPVIHKVDDECIKTYSSCLNLSDAYNQVSYKNKNGVTFFRKTWISAVDDILFMHIFADKPNSINFNGYLDRGIWCDSIYSKDNCLFLEDSHGIPFCVGVGAICDSGECKVCGNSIVANKCNQVLIFIDIRSFKYQKNISKKEYDKLILKNTWSSLCYSNLCEIKNTILKKGFDSSVKEFFEWHLNEYHSYWDRLKIQIGKNLKETECSTPDLLKKASKKNVELVNLYANFSRYLLISSSRVPGELPITLQGLWNCYMDPPWGSKYTININAQMNYWPVNMANLCECEEPFFELLERGYINGCDVAKKMYGCRGYLLHHNTDYWGDAAPQDTWIPGTYWVLGAAWMATHIWEHYEYTLDKSFLQKYYYLLHDACIFFVDYLQESLDLAKDGKPYLIINPTVSPENSYYTKTGQSGALCAGCEMDNMILEHLFKSCLNAKKVLQDKALSKNNKKYALKDYEDFEYVLNHLKEPSFNKDGSLMEWNNQVEEVELGHRHISHLYGLFPGHTISKEVNSEFLSACDKTLYNRLSNGGGHTGWSQAWILNFRTQLQEGTEALDCLTKLFQNSTLPNLLDNHPPFQIDGNFGAFAGILRMLVQSEFNANGEVLLKLLPALPKEKQWQSGSVEGILIKGGYCVSFEWENGNVKNLKLEPQKNAIDKKKIIIC